MVKQTLFIYRLKENAEFDILKEFYSKFILNKWKIEYFLYFLSHYHVRSGGGDKSHFFKKKKTSNNTYETRNQFSKKKYFSMIL